ncbi:hypothetical protein BASA83_012293 [Batrachochytrium salamandrivorans]|nr:hypothetical protein BASA83_012293 [Batrachochytrium salamandrivorans]
MANSDISVPSVNHRQEPSLHTTFSIYGLAAVSISYLRSILAPILGHQMEHVSKIDRRTTKHGARFRITVPEDRQRNIIQRLERQSKQTHWRIRQKLPTSPSRPTSTNNPTSTTITADTRSQCCQHQQQTTCYPPHRQEHQALGHLKDLHYLIQIPLYCTWFRCHSASSHGTWTQRNRPRYSIVLWWS